MNKRLWGLVALFAGIAAMLGLWVVMSGDPATNPGKRPEKGMRPGDPRNAGINGAKAIPISAERARLSVRDVAERQRRLTQPPGTVAEPGEEAPAAVEAGVFTLDQQGIASAVEERKADLDACYATALLHTPGLSGKMTLALQIEPVPGKSWGSVEAVESDSTMDATVLEGCLATVFQELRFDGTEPVTVRYPVSFTDGVPEKR